MMNVVRLPAVTDTDCPVITGAGCTVYPLPDDVPENFLVFKNGLFQCPSDYTVDRHALTLHGDVHQDDHVHVVY